LSGLLGQLNVEFTLDDSAEREFSIEIDPRTVDASRLSRLGDLGFNRISLGVQDLDHQVQLAVNRVQDPEATIGLISAARAGGFGSVSLDLIYGLPRQSPGSFMATIDAVISARPDRLSIYNYAHLPTHFRAQKLIDEDELPSAEERVEMLSSSIDRLTRAGYVYIGMDHFALPDDELTRARRDGTLQRNFQGYATFADCDLLGLGVSAISKVGSSYAQNIRELQHWNTALERGKSPLWRGIQLSFEDHLRRTVIESIMCHGKIDFQALEESYGIEVQEYFAVELKRLKVLRDDGLITLSEETMEVTPEGLLLLRAVAMVFDESLDAKTPAVAFSKVI
jgi:oxygen-independent coproporphyrinogen-3 oxidase